MNAGDIATRVQNAFGDSNGVFITDAMIWDWINEGQMEIIRETEINVATATGISRATMVAGLDISSYILLTDVYYGTRPLSLFTRESINRLGLGEFPEGVPEAYYTIGKKVYVFPTPQASDATTYSTWYVAAAATVDGASDTLDIPLSMHGDLANFCIMKAHQRNENWNAANELKTEFYKNIGQRKFEGLSHDDTYHTVGIDVADVDYPPYGFA